MSKINDQNADDRGRPREIGQTKDVTLSDRVRALIDEYLVDYSIKNAAIRAGYSAKTARTAGSRDFNLPVAQAYLKDCLAKRASERVAMEQRIVDELEKIAFFNIGELMTPDGEIDVALLAEPHHLANLAGIKVTQTGKVEYKFYDKLAALEKLGKHAGMFVDRHEVTGPNGGPIPVINSTMTPKEAADAYQKLITDGRR